MEKQKSTQISSYASLICSIYKNVVRYIKVYYYSPKQKPIWTDFMKLKIKIT